MIRKILYHVSFPGLMALVLGGGLYCLMPIFPLSWTGLFYAGWMYSFFSDADLFSLESLSIAIFCRILFSVLFALIGSKKGCVSWILEFVLSIMNAGYALLLISKVAKF